MTWQSVYVRPNGRDVVIIDYSTRDLAVKNTVESLTWLASHALKHDWLDHIASYLAAAEAFAATTEGAYVYQTHAGAKYLVREGQ